MIKERLHFRSPDLPHSLKIRSTISCTRHKNSREASVSSLPSTSINRHVHGSTSLALNMDTNCAHRSLARSQLSHFSAPRLPWRCHRRLQRGATSKSLPRSLARSSEPTGGEGAVAPRISVNGTPHPAGPISGFVLWCAIHSCRKLQMRHILRIHAAKKTPDLPRLHHQALNALQCVPYTLLAHEPKPTSMGSSGFA
eukprot:scaffold1166_cov261-Pinguiococcus_pyrenoidosus.AAC.67